MILHGTNFKLRYGSKCVIDLKLKHQDNATSAQIMISHPHHCTSWNVQNLSEVKTLNHIIEPIRTIDKVYVNISFSSFIEVKR